MGIVRSIVSVIHAIDRETRGDGMEILIGYMVAMLLNEQVNEWMRE